MFAVVVAVVSLLEVNNTQLSACDLIVAAAAAVCDSGTGEQRSARTADSTMMTLQLTKSRISNKKCNLMFVFFPLSFWNAKREIPAPKKQGCSLSL